MGIYMFPFMLWAIGTPAIKKYWYDTHNSNRWAWSCSLGVMLVWDIFPSFTIDLEWCFFLLWYSNELKRLKRTFPLRSHFIWREHVNLYCICHLKKRRPWYSRLKIEFDTKSCCRKITLFDQTPPFVGYWIGRFND